MKNSPTDPRVQRALEVLDLHYDSFFAVAPIATSVGHPVPVDTRGWSQILVSVLCGLNGLARRKGADLEDGSDVKAANTWEAIDTPRFNGVLKAGTQAAHSGKIESLNAMPFLFLVLWDHAPVRAHARCRIWVVRPQRDKIFRAMCQSWFEQRKQGKIKSNNFQLHPPRGRDSNIIRNSCGNLEYPLYFCAERAEDETYRLITFDEQVLSVGQCRKATDDSSAPSV